MSAYSVYGKKKKNLLDHMPQSPTKVVHLIVPFCCCEVYPGAWDTHMGGAESLPT